MKKRTIFLILILFSLFLNSCKYDFILPEEITPPPPGSDPISFSEKIIPIFAEKCISCHNTQAPVLTAAVAHSKLVPNYVNIASPASSKIYTLPKSGTHYATISASQAALILQWITEGAKNN